ncbi:MAG: hypothetical protein ACFFD1_02375 [Candidatus Thorarchaeota archaeon]
MYLIPFKDLFSGLHSFESFFSNVQVEGQLLSWTEEKSLIRKIKSFIFLSVSDGNTTVKICILNKQSKKSIYDYLYKFSLPGISITIYGNLSMNEKLCNYFDEKFYILSSISSNNLYNITILGCKSFRSWCNKTDFQDNDKPVLSKDNQYLTTASEILDNNKHFSSNTYLGDNSYQKHFIYEEKSEYDSDYSLPSSDHNMFSKKIENQISFHYDDYQWILSKEGEKLLIIPIVDDFFNKGINYNRPRLSTVFQFHPPNNGSAVFYWMTSDLKWKRIIEIQAHDYRTYEILKSFADKVKTISDIQSILEINKVKNYITMPDYDLNFTSMEGSSTKKENKNKE